MKHTKIICTIGPSSASVTRLSAMIRAGMNVARLNFSHGDYTDHAQLIANIRAAASKTGHTIAVLQDLQGPRIRTGTLPASGLSIKRRDQVVVTHQQSADQFTATGALAIPIQYRGLHNILKPGQLITIQDGSIVLEVQRIAGDSIACVVRQGGIVRSHKGVNLPGAQLAGSALTAKDKRDLAFGLEQGVDAVAVSFVQSARDITAVRRLIGRRPVIVIAKIERQEALDHIDEIIAAADGIMVARGDLGIELKIGQVPVWQKQIIDRCRTAGKPVIVATQMLESMMSHWRPTRAEASDVANAVMDHADAVMLSEETAVGEFPVETVRTMSHIIKQAEVSTYDDVQLADSLPTSTAEAQAMHLAHLARVPTVRAILIQAHDLNDLVPLLRFRPAIRIIVLTSSVIVQRQLSLVWGVIAYHMTSAQSITALLKQARTYAAPRSSARSSDQVVIVTTQPRVTILVD